MRDGTSSIHTIQLDDVKTSLAKLWATLLPFLLIWEYDNSENKPENKETSFIKWAKGVNPLSLHLKAFATTFELPSTIVQSSPNSLPSSTTLHVAIATISTGWYAWSSCWTRDAITSPWQSRTTTPIPAVLSTFEIAPS